MVKMGKHQMRDIGIAIAILLALLLPWSFDSPFVIWLALIALLIVLGMRLKGFGKILALGVAIAAVHFLVTLNALGRKRGTAQFR